MPDRMLLAATVALMISSGWYYTKSSLLEREVRSLRVELRWQKAAQEAALFEQLQKSYLDNEKEKSYEEIPSDIGVHTLAL